MADSSAVGRASYIDRFYAMMCHVRFKTVDYMSS